MYKTLGTERREAFDVFTMIAFRYFQEQKVDWIVLEVGVGGDIDATNIISTSELSIITSVGLDHIALLGKTKEIISERKCGIYKKNKPMVIGPNTPQDHIRDYLVNKMDASLENLFFVEPTQDGDQDYEVENNRVVRKAIEVLNLHTQVVDPAVVDKALKFQTRARMEKMNDRITYDGTQNVIGHIKSLSTFLSRSPKDLGSKIVIVMAFPKEGNLVENMQALSDHPEIDKVEAIVLSECTNSIGLSYFGTKCVEILDIIKRASSTNLSDKFKVIFQNPVDGEVEFDSIWQVFTRDPSSFQVVKDSSMILYHLEHTDSVKADSIFVMARLPFYRDVVSYVNRQANSTDS